MKSNIAPQMWFGTLYLFGFLGVLYAVFSGELQFDDSLRDMANILIGVLASGLLKILDFLYGSSAGSKAKTEAMIKERPAQIL
jgi:hypothetical protein